MPALHRRGHPEQVLPHARDQLGVKPAGQQRSDQQGAVLQVGLAARAVQGESPRSRIRGDSCLPTRSNKAKFAKVAPRVSVAWRPTGDTSLRLDAGPAATMRWWAKLLFVAALLDAAGSGFS